MISPMTAQLLLNALALQSVLADDTRGVVYAQTAAAELAGVLNVSAMAGYDASTATSGTIAATAGKPGLAITGAGGTTLTIKLPPSPLDGQQYWVASQGNFTTVTWEDAGGTAGNVIGGQASLGGAALGQRFVYLAGPAKWLSIG